jgi:hypothetical protein
MTATRNMEAQNAPADRSTDAVGRLIAELERKYLWWEPVGGEPHSECRIIAQAMNFGTFDDIRQLEKTLGPERLAEVMGQAEPTKLKTILDRAEAKDYRDIARMILAGVSLSAGLAAFRQMFKGEPSQVLRAIGYFKDGDLPTPDKADQDLLRNARDQVEELPAICITPGEIAVNACTCGKGNVLA